MKLTSIIPAALLLVTTSCATLTVRTDYDHAKDFTKFKTYGLYENPNVEKSVSQLNADRVTSAIRAQLNAKGYTESATPDFYVNVNTVLQAKKSVSADTDFYGYGGFYRPYGYWGAGPGMVTANTTFNVQDYTDGSLIIDMIDATENKLFWEGTGNAEIDGAISNPDQKISNAVAKILAPFPAAGMQPAVKK